MYMSVSKNKTPRQFMVKGKILAAATSIKGTT